MGKHSVRGVAPAGPTADSGHGSAQRNLRAALMRGSFWSVSFQIVSKSSLFVIGAIVARQLTVADYGIFLSVQGAVILGAAALDRGVSLSVEREAAISSIDNVLLRRLVRYRLLEGAALIPLVYLILDALRSQLPFVAKSSFAVAAASIYVAYVSNSYLQSQQRFRTSAILQSLGRATYLVLIVTLFEVSSSLSVAALCWALSEFLTACVQTANTFRALSRAIATSERVQRIDTIRAVLRRALPYWAAMVAYLAYNRADSAICLLFAGARQAGYYGPASNLQTAMMIIPAGLTASLAVVGSQSIASGEVATAHVVQEVRRLARHAVLVSIAASAVVVAGAPLLIDIFVGARYSAAVWPTRILICSLPFNAVQGALVGMLVALGKPRSTLFFYLACFITAVSLNGILTPTFGAIGAAIAGVVREPIGVVVLLILTRRALRESDTRLPTGQAIG